MTLPSNFKELSAKEQEALGLPPGFKAATPFPFEGMNVSDSAVGMDDKEFRYIENLMKLGNGNYRALPDEGPPFYTAPNGKTIISFFFYNIGPFNYVVVFHSDGTAVQIDTDTGVNTVISSVANTFYNTAVSTQLPACCQWGSTYLLISNNITQNSYWVWDGTDLHTSGTLNPLIVLTSPGSGYSGPPTITAFGGSGSGASFSATVTNGSVVSVQLVSPGSGYEPGETVQLLFTGGGSDDGAELQAVLSSGLVQSVVITNPGSGYAVGTYNLTFAGGGGAGAAGTYTVDASGMVTSTAVTAGGSGYTGTPTITFLFGGGAGADGVATLSSGTVAAVTVVNGGTGFTSTPLLTFVGGGGSGAVATAVLTGGSISSVSVTNGGSGYTSVPAVKVQTGINNAASASVSLMPFGVSGSSIETFQSRVWISFPFQPATTNGVQQAGGKVNISAPGSFSDFATSSGGLIFNSTDSFLRAQYTNLKQSNGYLYPIGDSSVSVISNVQTSGNPTSTSFNYQNTDPQTGSSWRDSVVAYSRTVLFANPLGIYGLYGGAVTKISGKIDQLFTDAVFPPSGGALTPTAAVANVYSKKIFCLLMTFKDPFTLAHVNKMVCWDEKDFFIASQSAALIYIGTQEVSSNIKAWGTDGRSLYPLFYAPSALITKKMSTKLYGTQDAVIKKRAYTFMFQGQDQTSNNSGITLNVNIDTNFTSPETGLHSYPIPQPVSFNAAIPTFPFVSTSSGDIYGMNIGCTFTSNSPDFTVNFLALGYINEVAEMAINGG